MKLGSAARIRGAQMHRLHFELYELVFGRCRPLGIGLSLTGWLANRSARTMQVDHLLAELSRVRRS